MGTSGFDGYPGIANSGRSLEVHSQEELHSPSRQLEEAVVRLQQDIADYRPTKRSGFTPDTPMALLWQT